MNSVDMSNDRGGTGSEGVFQLARFQSPDHLVNIDFPFFYSNPPASRQCDNAVAGNTSQYGSPKGRRDQFALNLEHDIHGSGFLKVFMLLTIRPEKLLIAFFTGY